MIALQLRTRLAVAALFGATLCGCGERPVGPVRHETRGVVTYRGAPVPDAQVVFFAPVLGVSRGAITAEDGSFRVVAASGNGLPAGEYSAIVRPPPKGDEEMIEYSRPDIPVVHRSKKSSKITATITEGDNVIEIELAVDR